MNKKHTLFKQTLVSACCAFALVGCGGGGGSDGAPVANDANATGQASENSSSVAFSQAHGNVLLAQGNVLVQPHVTLDDAGTAVAIWAEGFTSELYASSSDAAGNWTTPSLITKDVHLGFAYALATNTAGQRVLLAEMSTPTHGVESSAFFFKPGDAGWSAAVPLSRTLAALYPDSSDLQVTSDGSALISVKPYDTSGPSSANRTGPAELYRLRPNGAQTTGIQSIAMSATGKPIPSARLSNAGAVFALPPTGAENAFRTDGFFFWQEADGVPPGYSSLAVLRAQYDQPFITMEARGLYQNTAAGSATCSAQLLRAAAASISSAVVLSGDMAIDRKQCILKATRIDTSLGWDVKTFVLSSPGADVSDAKLLQDGNGRVLAVWAEKSTDDPRSRYMWSQSLANGIWSTPTELALSLGIPADSMTALPAVKMSLSGDAVLALTTTDHASTGKLSYSRFDFASGWSAPVGVAEGKVSLGFVADIAINTAGKAVIVYSVTGCPDYQRSGLWNCGKNSAYAYFL
ncbi:hypothetical protein BTH42_14890 [Burkholderia sp. SRS-W-2-2016]|uniref:hypothetical protein n=1 Tax=Burkholderia sp. SRS-W-2-2016 TaxID=1926878 RepID=UPI00094AF079|nr:hypothetical protein [Burkholderia sp. SRS-W-2-2016]OLL30860.1 hypothetical protein BTH42_14890 [Burkholderia sp. SRS-W-2-2016]